MGSNSRLFCLSQPLALMLVCILSLFLVLAWTTFVSFLSSFLLFWLLYGTARFILLQRKRAAFCSPCDLFLGHQGGSLSWIFRSSTPSLHFLVAAASLLVICYMCYPSGFLRASVVASSRAVPASLVSQCGQSPLVVSPYVQSFSVALHGQPTPTTLPADTQYSSVIRNMMTGYALVNTTMRLAALTPYFSVLMVVHLVVSFLGSFGIHLRHALFLPLRHNFGHCSSVFKVLLWGGCSK